MTKKNHFLHLLLNMSCTYTLSAWLCQFHVFLFLQVFFTFLLSGIGIGIGSDRRYKISVNLNFWKIEWFFFSLGQLWAPRVPERLDQSEWFIRLFLCLYLGFLSMSNNLLSIIYSYAKISKNGMKSFFIFPNVTPDIWMLFEAKIDPLIQDTTRRMSSLKKNASWRSKTLAKLPWES